MARQPKGRGSGSGGRSPLLGSPVTSAEEQFANGVANLLTATGAARALQITGVPPEWEVRRGLAFCGLDPVPGSAGLP